MQKDDEQLISAYLEGDDHALTVLVDRYLKDAYNFALKLTNDKHIAEDITQESFMKAWKNIRKFISGNSFRGWLFRIIYNTSIDYLRKTKELPFSNFENSEGHNLLVETLTDKEPLQDELLAQAENVRYLENFLSQLNPRYREVLTLRHTSNMTFDEIGKVLKKPIHTVKSQYRRGLASLRRLLDIQTA
ncbi:MAG: sigma-70 family RNA polymerase sigma factor [Candidatus Paceibacterota bacterium]|jgi:RNA polymerase sigma-70 factor (ECF subfamily)